MSISKWISEQPGLYRFLLAWLLFISAAAFGAFVNDFGEFSSMEVMVFPESPNATIAARVTALALLSVVNVYFVPASIRRLGSDDRYKGQFWSVLIGFFGLVLCAPLAVIGLGFGLSATLLLMFTGIHMIFQSANKKNN